MHRHPRLLVANHSGYPSDSSAASDPDARRRAIRDAVRAQVEAGLDIVTDGQVGQAHALERLVRGLGGLALSDEAVSVPGWDLVRVPIIEKPLRWEEPLFLDDLRVAQEAAGDRRVKISFAGPHTLACLARDPQAVYDSLGARVEACAKVLAQEVQALAREGVSAVQIEERAILGNPRDFPRLKEAMIPLAEMKGDAALALALSGNAIAPLYDWLQNLRVDILGLDLVHSPRLIDMIGDRETPMVLALGLLDSETADIERRDDLLATLKRLLAGTSAAEVHVQPAASLRGLDPAAAQAKLANLVGLVEEHRASLAPSG